MSTSLGYKAFQGVLRATRYRNRMPKDAARGHQRNMLPKGQWAKRWRKEAFEGRAVWICDPSGGPTERVYIHLHGGGYVYGIQSLHYMALGELADHAEMTVIMPDYPLPPDAQARDIIGWADRHFACAVDCYWLENVSLGGDSAGANLALAVLQRRASRGEPQPEINILWSPWLDLTGPREFTKDDDYEALITPFGLEPAVRGYLGDMDRNDPLISPIGADMGMLPPMHIVSGGQDILHDDGVAFADRARAAGKLASLTVEPDYGHYWMFYPVKDRHRTLREIGAMLAG